MIARHLRFLAFLPFVPAAACQTAHKDAAAVKLINGDEASEGEFPGVFRILAGGTGGCTATKVGARFYITAGHCVMTRSTPAVPQLDSNYDMKPGRTNWLSPKVVQGASHIEVTIKGLWVPKSWYQRCKAVDCGVISSKDQEPLAPDVAIVEVEPTPEWDAIPSARIGQDAVAPGMPVVMSGFGCETKTWTSADKPRLKTFATATEGFEALAPFSTRAEDQGRRYLFTPGKHANAAAASLCSGDSGGPLLRLAPDGVYDVVGINASYSFADEASGVSDVNWFTRLDGATPEGLGSWIASVLSGAGTAEHWGGLPAATMLQLVAEPQLGVICGGDGSPSYWYDGGATGANLELAIKGVGALKVTTATFDPFTGKEAGRKPALVKPASGANSWKATLSLGPGYSTICVTGAGVSIGGSIQGKLKKL